ILEAQGRRCLRMKESDYFFLFGVVQSIGSIATVLMFFGLDLAGILKTKKTVTASKPLGLKIMLAIFVLGSFLFSGIGWYLSRHTPVNNSEIRTFDSGA